MIKKISSSTIVLYMMALAACQNEKWKENSTATEPLPIVVKQDTFSNIDTGNMKQIMPADSITSFLPKGYTLFEKSRGDLNSDGKEDVILMIKGTDKNDFFKDENRGLLDRNRRGLIVLFKKENGYELADKNVDCFSSENEDGGVYFAPELSVEANKGKLIIHYGHGRYGFWSYTFRYQNSGFALIGYDASSNQGPTVLQETSINFITKKKIEKVNINPDIQDGAEVFEEKVSKVKESALLKLSKIIDFDELGF